MKKTKKKNSESEILIMFKKSKTSVNTYCKVYLTNLKSGQGSKISYGTENYCYGLIKEVKLLRDNEGIAIGITYIVDPLDGKISERLVKKRLSSGIEPINLKRECSKLKRPIDWSVLNELLKREYDEIVSVN
jgi:hypothetical protein